ncbi:MAG: SDR family oxidoreductase [Acidimicrobiia bacterium]|nr:MAG: SDR family oxidoreductase [Acidimicrobiia bacterium]
MSPKPEEWAVVVGASGAIGSRIVERLAERGLGVLAVGRTRQALEAVGEGLDRFAVCVADIADDDSVPLIRDAMPGPCRAAINAAAAPMGGHVDEVSAEAVLGAVDVKVNGTLRLLRAVDGELIDDSRIIVLGGNLAYDPIPEAATAGVGNAALANLIRQLSQSLGKRRVTCHVVAPGPVWTARLRTLLADAAAARGVSEAAVMEEFRARSPIGHIVTVDEVAWAVMTLLDPEARALAGGTLLLDAGQRTAVP